MAKEKKEDFFLNMYGFPILWREERPTLVGRRKESHKNQNSCTWPEFLKNVFKPV
jgi:hypothetical protein